MGRRIICPKCNTVFDEDILKQKNSENTCLVCAANLSDSDTIPLPTKEKTTYYYYKERGGTLTDTLYDREPLYTFEAVDMEDAERQLKEILPNSPLLNDNPTPEVRCPRCGGTRIELVPRKYSILTGFTTNKLDRACVYCKKRF